VHFRVHKSFYSGKFLLNKGDIVDFENTPRMAQLVKSNHLIQIDPVPEDQVRKLVDPPEVVEVVEKSVKSKAK
jgi:hypothetical protein